MRRTTKTSMRTALLALAVTAFGSLHPAGASDIRVLSAAAVQSALKQIAGDFERRSGHRLVVSYTTMGAITQRMLGGETADVVIGSTPSIAQLVKAGKILSETEVQIGKLGVGVVAAADSAHDVTLVEDLKSMLWDAKTVIYANPAAGGAAGIHMARVIEQLGLTERVAPKTKFGTGGDITELTLAEGKGAIGFTQISDIVGKPGAVLLGPLPVELQNYTGVTLGIPPGGDAREAVLAFVAYLGSPDAIAVLRAKGVQTE